MLRMLFSAGLTLSAGLSLRTPTPTSGGINLTSRRIASRGMITASADVTVGVLAAIREEMAKAGLPCRQS